MNRGKVAYMSFFSDPTSMENIGWLLLLNLNFVASL